MQRLSPSLLLLVANALAPPLPRRAFRPPGYRAGQRALLAAAATCHALRAACFPVAARVLRSPQLRPLAVADLGESARELEAKIDFLLAHEHLWPYIQYVPSASFSTDVF